VLLLAGSILGNYMLGELIHRHRARAWLICGITANLLLLAWFKYANFLVHAVLQLHAQELHIFLPLAISFFTFQQIMYLVESYRGERVDGGLLTYASFVAFFPHLIAGPIVRPSEIMPQLLAKDLAVPRAERIAEGVTIFLLGMAKKVVLADSFARYADIGFGAASQGASLSFFDSR
jgi:alginate O-acetyltransferase complex protein AlgI